MAERVKSTAAASTAAPSTSYWDEKVPIKLFKDDGKYTGDVFVRVRNKPFVIKRGVEVMVPRYVAEVLKQSQEQREAAVMHSEQLQKDFELASAGYGIKI